MGLQSHYNKVRQYTPQRVEADLLNIYVQEERLATDLVTDQLFQGKDSKGKDLPPYSQQSVLYFNKPEGAWRLYDSGDFYRGVFLQINGDRVVFDSRDNKRDEIFTKLEYAGHNSDDVLGLNRENILLNGEVKRKTITYYRQMLAV